MTRAVWIFRRGRLCAKAVSAASGLRTAIASRRLYQSPILTRIKIASNAVRANQPIDDCPNGMTINAANRGPIALPAFPPTWKIDCASPLRPPEASCATREDSGWNTDEPQPISPTAIRIQTKPGAKASTSSPASVKHIPPASE